MGRRCSSCQSSASSGSDAATPSVLTTSRRAARLGFAGLAAITIQSSLIGFLNPANGGYGSVALTAAMILDGGAILCQAYAWLATLRSTAPSEVTPGEVAVAG